MSRPGPLDVVETKAQRTVVRAALRAGYSIRVTADMHVLITAPDGRSTTLSGRDGDWHVDKNVLRDARRIGLRV
jgi:hypothetical protein